MRMAVAPRSTSAAAVAVPTPPAPSSATVPGLRVREASAVGPLEAREVGVERVRRTGRSEQQRVRDAGTDHLVGCIGRGLPGRRLERHRDVDASVAGTAELLRASPSSSVENAASRGSNSYVTSSPSICPAIVWNAGASDLSIPRPISPSRTGDCWDSVVAESGVREAIGRDVMVPSSEDLALEYLIRRRRWLRQC